MNLVEWSEKFSVGDASMDAYHHIFFEMVKEFMAEARRGTFTQAELGDWIHFLGRYTLMHFRAEERLLERCNYPELEQHRAIHRSFAQEIAQLTARFEQYPEALPAQEVFTKAMLWFAQHILGEDMKYRPFMGGKA